MVLSASSLYFFWRHKQREIWIEADLCSILRRLGCFEMSPGDRFWKKPFEDRFTSVIYLADNVPHLLSMDDVGGVDDRCVAGPVHLSSMLVLNLRKRKPSCTHYNCNLKHMQICTRSAAIAKAQWDSDLAEDVSSVPGPHEVWGVCSQSQHALALDLLLQRLLVLSL